MPSKPPTKAQALTHSSASHGGTLPPPTSQELWPCFHRLEWQHVAPAIGLSGVSPISAKAPVALIVVLVCCACRTKLVVPSAKISFRKAQGNQRVSCQGSGAKGKRESTVSVSTFVDRMCQRLVRSMRIERLHAEINRARLAACSRKFSTKRVLQCFKYYILFKFFEQQNHSASPRILSHSSPQLADHGERVRLAVGMCHQPASPCVHFRNRLPYWLIPEAARGHC